MSFNELLAIEEKQNNLQKLHVVDNTQIPTTSSRMRETEKTHNLTDPFYFAGELNYQTITVDDIFECFENKNVLKQNPAVSFPIDISGASKNRDIEKNKVDHHSVCCSLIYKLLTIMCRILACNTNILNISAQNTDFINFLNAFEKIIGSTFENNMNAIMIELQEYHSIILNSNVNRFKFAKNLNVTNEEYNMQRRSNSLKEQLSIMTVNLYLQVSIITLLILM
ncbi:hypothetical protein COBT_002938 [Conglomerata obtusa]